MIPFSLSQADPSLENQLLLLQLSNLLPQQQQSSIATPALPPPQATTSTYEVLPWNYKTEGRELIFPGDPHQLLRHNRHGGILADYSPHLQRKENSDDNRGDQHQV